MDFTTLSASVKNSLYCVRMFEPLLTLVFLICRVVSAVYDMLGATGHLGKTQELFSKLDANSDGSISQEEFVAVIKKDKSLLDVLQGKQALV